MSLLLHGVAYAALDGAPPRRDPAPRTTQVRFDVVSASRAAPQPPPPQQPPPEPRKKEPRKSEPPERQVHVPPATAPTEAPAPPAPLAETELSGVTLSGDDTDNTFRMPLGSGGALAPDRRPSGRPNPPPPKAASLPRPEVALVGVNDLSSRPAPPALADVLQRHYPAAARQRGLSGSAKVRARIDPDGVVRQVALLQESAPGFGAACRGALAGSRWGAPKDRAGRSVATEIRYTCRFVVQP